MKPQINGLMKSGNGGIIKKNDNNNNNSSNNNKKKDNNDDNDNTLLIPLRGNSTHCCLNTPDSFLRNFYHSFTIVPTHWSVTDTNLQFTCTVLLLRLPG